jgi:2-(1,2-epoxy-1,2-dihydrophenyl)acetyl-CoA isomerase
VPTDTNPVEYTTADGIGHIALNRPEVSNSINLATAHALAEAIAKAEADDAVRVILLTGNGPRFCAGGDLPSVMAAVSPSAALLDLATSLDYAHHCLSTSSKPVVAAVQGAVAGAGLALMLSADLVVTTTATKFVTAYAGVGLTPDCGLSWLLPRAVGQQRALDLLLTGRTLNAHEALDWGLVSRVVEPDDLTTAAGDIAARIAANPPFAMSHAKRLTRDSWAKSRAETGSDEAHTIASAIATDDARALITKFFNR